MGTVSTSYSALALDADNAETVAGEVAVTGSETVGVGDIGASMVTAVVVATGDRPALSELARWTIETVDGLRGQMVATATGVTLSDVVACTSGSMNITWNDADDNGEFSTGDSFSVTFNSCVEAGVTVNGALAMAGLAITGDPDVDIAWSMGASFTFSSLALTDGAYSVRIDGDLDFAMSTQNGDDFAVGISGTRLAYLEGGQTTTLRDFAFSYLEQQSSGLYALDYAGTLDIGSLTGRITFATTTPFTGSDILDAWPTAGVLVITGANASTITLEALGGGLIRLSIDSDGDGGVNQTIDSSWTALTTV